MSNNTIKIVILLSGFEKSGVTTVIYNICKYLDPTQFSLHFITLFPERVLTDIDQFKALPVTIHALNLSRKTPDFLIKAPLLQKCREIGPHLIHTHTFRADLLAGIYLSHYKRIVTLHSILEHNNSNTHGNLLGSFMAWLQIRYFKKATGKIVVSHAIANHYHDIKGIHTIQNGADPAVFKQVTNDQKKILRNKLHIPTDATVFISVGALSNRKDPLTIIQSFIQANQNGKGILLFLGAGPLEKACIQAIEQTSQVQLLGQVQDTLSYYQAADCLISAAHSEGLPNTVLEAGLCGLPCILSDIPQHREIFQEADHPYPVEFFPVLNSQDLARLIQSFKSHDKPAAFPLNAIKMAKAYGAYYQKLME